MIEVRDEKIYIKIAWATGGMEVVPEFFPVEMSRTRKIFKLLLADETWTKDHIDILNVLFLSESTKRLMKSDIVEREAAETAALAKTIKPHKRSTLSWGDDAWRHYEQTRDLAKRKAAEAKRLQRESDNLVKTRDLLLKMTGVSA